MNLAWSDIDFENQRISISPKTTSENTVEWEPKDHEQRVVPMSDEATRLLAHMQVESASGSCYVFIKPQRLERIKKRIKMGKWNSKSEVINNLLTNFKRYRRRAGIPECSIHDLRRSAITNWAQKLPIQVVRQLAGHSDISTTNKYYLVVRPEDMIAANEALNHILEK